MTAHIGFFGVGGIFGEKEGGERGCSTKAVWVLYSAAGVPCHVDRGGSGERAGCRLGTWAGRYFRVYTLVRGFKGKLSTIFVRGEGGGQCSFYVGVPSPPV